MNDNGPDTYDISRLESAQQGVPEQSGTEPLPLPIKINGKSGQQHDRDRVAREALAEAFRCIFVNHLTNSQAVEPDDLALREGDIACRPSRLLVSQCETVEESIQAVLATMEGRRVVLSPEFVDSKFVHSNTPGSCRSCLSRG